MINIRKFFSRKSYDPFERITHKIELLKKEKKSLEACIKKINEERKKIEMKLTQLINQI